MISNNIMNVENGGLDEKIIKKWNGCKCIYR